MWKGVVLVGLVALAVGVAIIFFRRTAVHEEAGLPEEVVKSAPEFPRDTEWLQSKPLTLASLRDQVVIVHFWTNGCINCIHNYPVYKAWQKKYAGNGVTIIGVHTPEFAEEANVERVRTKARANGLEFPIAIDTDTTIWNRWENHYWPSIYLIDKKGLVSYHWDGELHLENVEDRQFASRIDELLAEMP